MEEPISVAWIDDKFADETSARTAQAQAIIEAGGDRLSVELVPSTNEDFREWVSKFDVPEQPRPDILVLDFKLAHSPEFAEPLKLDDGYKLRKVLELTPLRLVPKYLVSAVFDAKKVGPNVEGFEWILADPVDSESVSGQLISDGKGYRLINTFTAQYPTNTDEALKFLLQELKTPEESLEEVADLVRHALGRAQQSSTAKEHAEIDSAGTGPEASALAFSWWLRGTLLVRLGPLIDAPSVANLLGADQEYFEQKLAQVLREQRPSASYQGLFSHQSSPRWWYSEIINWLLESFGDLTQGPISQLAPSVAEKLNIPEKDRARCAVCGKLWPDVVAYDVDDIDELRQVHRYCSEVVEDQEIVLGFDEIRCFRKD